MPPQKISPCINPLTCECGPSTEERERENKEEVVFIDMVQVLMMEDYPLIHINLNLSPELISNVSSL